MTREIRFQWQYKDESPVTNAEDVDDQKVRNEDDMVWFIKNAINNDFPEKNIDNLIVLRWEFTDTNDRKFSQKEDTFETVDTFVEQEVKPEVEQVARVDFIPGSELTEVMPNPDVPQEEKIFMKVENNSMIKQEELDEMTKASSPFYYPNLFLSKAKFDNPVQAYHYGAILTVLTNWNNTKDKNKLANTIIAHAKFLKD